MKQNILTVAVLTTASLVLASAGFTDSIHLKNGNTLDGTIEASNDQKVTINVPGAGRLILEQGEIASIEKSLSQQADEMKRDAAVWLQQALSLPEPESGAEVFPSEWVVCSEYFECRIKKKESFDHLNTGVAIEILAQEVRQMQLRAQTSSSDQGGSTPRHKHLQLALSTFSEQEGLSRCSEEQLHLIVALAIQLLDDQLVILDFSRMDGRVERVRHLALKSLETVSAEHFGGLVMEGGLMPPGVYEQMKGEDRTTVENWKTWWAKSAGLTRNEWLAQSESKRL